MICGDSFPAILIFRRFSNEKIEVTIKADGTVEYETQGFVGQTCQEEIQKIMLNGKTEEDSKKKEFYDGVPEFINNI